MGVADPPTPVGLVPRCHQAVGVICMLYPFLSGKPRDMLYPPLLPERPRDMLYPLLPERSL